MTAVELFGQLLAGLGRRPCTALTVAAMPLHLARTAIVVVVAVVLAIIAFLVIG